MSLIHVQKTAKKLRHWFSDLIDMSDHANKSDDMRDDSFLSRALAAAAVKLLASCETEDAANAVTDGYGDNGIDAIFFDELRDRLILVQSKWKRDGTGSFSRSAIRDFLTGVELLISDNSWEEFNSKIRLKADEIRRTTDTTESKVILAAVHTGKPGLSDNCKEEVDKFLTHMNDTSEVFEFRYLNQDSIWEFVSTGQRAKIDREIEVLDFGVMHEPYKAYYGKVQTLEVADWHDQYGAHLFSLNLRLVLGDSEVNRRMAATLKNEPEAFWYFNNGITCLCDSVEPKIKYSGRREVAVLVCKNLAVVNGAQTVGSIGKVGQESLRYLDKAYVMVRFVSLEDCPENFGDRITEATNLQNSIKNRDFISLDPRQHDFKNELESEGVTYVFKRGERKAHDSQGFNLEEATIALACAHRHIRYAVLAKGKFGALWDKDEAPYSALFHQKELTGDRIWSLVRIMRRIESELHLEGRQRRRRERQCVVLGNLLIAYRVFRDLRIETKNLEENGDSIEELSQTAAHLARENCAKLIQAIDELYPEAYINTLLKNQEKCQILSSRMSGVEEVDLPPRSPGLFDLIPPEGATSERDD